VRVASAAMNCTVELHGEWADKDDPRIDAITTSTHAGRSGSVRLLTGTALPRADLANLEGAPCIPVGHDLLEYVRVPPASGWHTHTVDCAPALVSTVAHDEGSHA
jgi:hypothetical protein